MNRLSVPRVLGIVAALAVVTWSLPVVATGDPTWFSSLPGWLGGTPRYGTGVQARAGALDSVMRPWERYADGQVREFHLTVARTQVEIAPGKIVDAFAYNGQIPGPELRVTEGDVVRVTVTNGADEPTTVHWHGLELPITEDGTPGLSQEPIQPGASFTYEFVATPAGTRWYHSHFNEITQHGGGLYGALIVEPRQPEPQPIARDYTVIAGEFVTGVRPYGASTDHDHAGMVNGLPLFDTFLVNGKSYPGGAPLVVREGERVRLRLINAGATETQRFALAGHHLTITHSDGNPLADPVDTDVVTLGAGERADVEFLADHPGRWQLTSLTPGHAERGLAVDVAYEGHEADPVQLVGSGDGLQVADYRQFHGPTAPSAADRAFELTLTQGDNPADGWKINGQRYPDTVPLDIYPGERVRVSLHNLSGEDHPMHLHGHSFQVVGIQGQLVDGPIKDTLTVRPDETYDIVFSANNPSAWLYHCHNLAHVGGGMTVELHYR
jgi:FtsP/CotA-like multicopper oxidase with cupredoxin domain